jgi:predicted aspartyl protease
MNSSETLSLAKPMAILVFLFFAVFPSAAQSTPAATGFAGCPVPIAPTAGDKALAQDNATAAEPLFREAMKAPGEAGEKAHDGLIRALIDENKVTDAAKEAKAWQAAAPSDVWARIAGAEVMWRQGDFANAQSTLQDVSKTAGCNAQLHLDFAKLLDFMGLYATAGKQIALAHNLDPENPDIYAWWLSTQPRSVRLEAVNNRLTQDKNLSAEEKADLEERKKALSSPGGPKSCRVVSAMKSVTMPFRMIHRSPEDPVIYGLDVALDGKGRRLEVDTGASGIILYKSAANALHLTPEIHYKSYGVGDSGDVKTFAAKVSSVKIGGVEFADCWVQVIDDDNQRDSSGAKIDSAEDGLIGGDVFDDFILTLDFPGQQVKLDPLPPLPTGTSTDAGLRDRYIDPSMAAWTKMFRGGHDIILPVGLSSGKIHLFIVDTGAFDNLISPEAAREVGQLSNISDIDIYGVSGHVRKTYSTQAMDLAFAGLRQHVDSLTASDMSRMGANLGVEISGFIGAKTLHVLTMQIDYRDNLLHFTYDPKRVQRCVTGVKVGGCS